MGTQIIVGAILAGMFMFGIAYDQFVAWVERTHRDHGLASVLVICGVAITLMGMGLLDLFVSWNAGLLGLACFAASGSPMAGGSMIRYLLRKAEQERRMRDITLTVLREQDDDTA